MRKPLCVCAILMGGWCMTAFQSLAQPINVTFRWIPSEPVERVFLPGTFNNWGPNSGGQIAANAPSRMTLDSTSGQWLYTTTLLAGQTHQYKIHVHRNSSGSDYSWITDPLNDRSNPDEYNNSVLTVADPMIFQMARHVDQDRNVTGISAGVFASRDISELRFAVNGEEFDGLPYTHAGFFLYELPEVVPCDVEFTLKATDSAGNTVEATSGLRPPQVANRARPAHTLDGVNYDPQDPTKATLSVFAPNRCYVHAIGDFNDWEISDASLMYRDGADDSVHWWMPLDNLTPGQEVAYQYVLENERRIADLFSTKILDPGSDGDIPASTYPDLKPYPHGKTTGHVSVLETAMPAYEWQITDFEPPPAGELIIYELLVRDFVHAHDWRTLTDTLSYLERLGVNAIELMPVSEFGGNINWGYQPQFHMALDKYYGPPEDFKRFVDAAHARGMAVLLDVVYNHVDAPSPMVLSYESVFANPWLNLPPTHPYNVFFDINHEDLYIQHWLDRMNAFWLTEFNVDGFRFDLSKGFTQRRTTTFNDWASYDPSRVRLVKRMVDHIWSVNPKTIVILEHWTHDREERELAEYRMDEGYPGMLMWTSGNGPYSEAVMGYHDSGKSDFSWVYYGKGGRNWTLPHVITYMGSHDDQWLMYRALMYGACENSPVGGAACDPGLASNDGTYNVRNLPVALDRLKMAGAFHFLLPGPHMLFQFAELGYGYGERGEQCLEPYDCPPFAPGRIDPKPIRWDYRTDPLRMKLYDTWAALIKLRREQPVFHSPETEVEIDARNAVKRITLKHPDMQVEIIGNFGVKPDANTSRISTPPRYWYDYFSGDSLDVTGNRAATLMPGEFHIYSSRRLPAPPKDLLTVGRAEGPVLDIGEFGITGNYPNPFTNLTTIEYVLSSGERVNIEVFDLLGRRIAVAEELMRLPGRHTLQLDTSDWAPGVYAVRLKAGHRMSARKLLRIR